MLFLLKPPVSRSREPSSLLPRPLNKAAGEPNLKVAATPKRMSVGAGRVKVDAIAAESVKGIIIYLLYIALVNRCIRNVPY